MWLNIGLSEEKIHRWHEQKNIKKLGRASRSKHPNFRRCAARALLDIGEQPALQLAERLLNDSNEEIQTLVAQRLQTLHHEPEDPVYRIAKAILLRDRSTLTSMKEQARPYLVRALRNLATGSATFAAEILAEEGYAPQSGRETAAFLLARHEFERLPELGATVLPVVDEYCAHQSDVAHRRRAVQAVLQFDDTAAALRSLKKYAEDKDEEIANLAKSRIAEIERQQFVKTKRHQWKSFFDSPGSNSTEGTATRFIRMGMEYLERELYYEAYCVLAIADYIYENLTGGYTIREGLTIGDLNTRRDREIKVFGDFMLNGVLERISKKIQGKKEAETLASLLLARSQASDGAADNLTLSKILKAQLIYDKELVKSTIDFLIAHEDDSRRAWRAILNLPDKRLVPSLIDSFQYGEFLFDPVQALIYIDEDAVPALLEALRHTDHKYKTNAAFCLGIIGSKDATKPLARALEKEKNLAAKLTLHFALVRGGDKDKNADCLYENLTHEKEEVRRQAARCIRHLKSDIRPSKLVKHIDHPDDVVRMYVLGTLLEGEQGLPDDILKQLVDRLTEEKDENVLDKLVSGLGEMKENKKLIDLLLARLPKAGMSQQEKIVSILGNLGAQQALKPMIALWTKANSELKRSLIWALGQLGAVESLNRLTTVLKNNKELRRVAAFGLVFLSNADQKAVTKAIRNIHNPEARMARALLNDESAVDQISEGLSPYGGIQKIFENLDAAMVVQSSEFVQPLYRLLDYSNEDYYPTDRYVRHGALEALCKTILAN
ncbi:MAG: HEAT repeat domain-containing protein [bacterium]